MNPRPHSHHSEDDLAAQLSHYLDAVLAHEPTVPEPAPEIADLALMARAFASAPRPVAPDDLHQRMRARLRADHTWRDLAPQMQTTAARPFTISTNGHRHTDANLTARPVETESPPGRSLPRIVPILEVLALAAGLLIFVYIAFGRHQSADQPTPTVLPTPMTTPATSITPAPPPGAVGDWPMLGGGPTRAGGDDRFVSDTAPVAKWSTTLPAGIRAPVAAGDAVYVTNGGVLIALAADTGAERWRFDLGVDPSVAGANPPAVVGGVVYLATKAGVVIAVNATTGEPIWTHQLEGAVTTSVAVDVVSATLIVGTNSGALYALDLATGDARWRVTTGAISVSSPVIADDLVYVGTGNLVVASDLATGEMRWQKSVKAGMQSIAVGGGIAIVGGSHAGSNRLLIALDATNGDLRWQDQYTVDRPPAIVGKVVYITDGGRLVAFDSARGAYQWTYPGSIRLADSLVAGDAIIACRIDGVIASVERATGKERWTLATGAAAVGLTVGAGVIYVAESDGDLTAYGS